MASTYFKNKTNSISMSKRIKMLTRIVGDFHETIRFSDNLRFQTLFSIYSENIKDLYNTVDSLSDEGFREKVLLLAYSIEKLKIFIIP